MAELSDWGLVCGAVWVGEFGALTGCCWQSVRRKTHQADCLVLGDQGAPEWGHPEVRLVVVVSE